MLHQRFLELIEAIHRERVMLCETKGHDYATEDTLSNFKRMHTYCAQMNISPARSPADCALFLALLKFDRWCNLRAKGASPKNESVQDTIKDLHNYIDLAYACEVDVSEEQAQKLEQDAKELENFYSKGLK